MCDTMASASLEERPPCILTEDMFDAFSINAYQDVIESEDDEESNFQDIVMDIDSQGVPGDNSENISMSVPSSSNTEVTKFFKEKTPDRNSPGVSVVVIETGLDQSKHSNALTQNFIPNNNNFEENTEGNQGTLNSDKPDTSNKDNGKLTLLKQILSKDSLVDNENSIDLCESDTDDDFPDADLLDNNLKSLMQNNLMEEIGILQTVDKLTPPEIVSNKPINTSPNIPKIAIKSIAHVPTSVFNTLPPNKVNHILTPERNIPSANISKSINNMVNKNAFIGEILHDKNIIPTTIKFNKIAIPHQTFVNSKGQKMKCVYVRKSNTMPIVINNVLPAASNKVSPHITSPQVKTVLPKQQTIVSKKPIYITKSSGKNVNAQKTIVTNVPKKTITVTPKFHKPPSLAKKVPAVNPMQFSHLNTFDSLVKALLLNNVKKPYKPPSDISPNMRIYSCVDCGDRFLLQTSLNQHMARRSVCICYWCRVCQLELHFFNRCVFLNHLRGHGCSIMNIDTTCIKFSPLPQEMFDNGVVSSFLVGPRLESNKLTDSNNIQPVTSVIVPNLSNEMTTSVKSKCIQAKYSTLFNGLISSSKVTSDVSKLTPNYSECTRNTGDNYSKQELTTPNIQELSNLSLLKNKQLASQIGLEKSTLPVQKITSSVQSTIAPVNNVQSNLTDLECDVFTLNNDDSVKAKFVQEEDDIDVETVAENSPATDSTTKKQFRIAPKSNRKYVRHICSECGIASLNIKRHLIGTNRPVSYKLACEICNLILPTKCSLKIHKRLHTKLPPYKCPECGREFRSWDALDAHVKYICGHSAKCIRFHCLACKAHFATRNMLIDHFLSEHVRDFVKCALCPCAFRHRDSFNRHLETLHKHEEVHGMNYKNCSMCPKKLLKTDEILPHVHTHTYSSNVFVYAYKCPLCFMVFPDRMTFISHQEKERHEIEEKALSPNQSNNQNGNPLKKQNMSSCPSLSVSNSDVEDEPIIYKKYPGLEDESVPTEKDPLSLDDWEHPLVPRVQEKREELCVLCKENYVILLPGTNLNEQSLCCKLCVRPLDSNNSKSHKPIINNSLSLPLNHRISTKNGLNSSIFTPNKRKSYPPKAVQRSLSCDDAQYLNKKKKLNGPDVSLRNNSFMDGLRMKKRNRKKQTKTNTGDVTRIQGQVMPPKTSNSLLCAKCDFLADTRDTFLVHINTHRTEPNTFQCLECGLCFVVLPALERHLHINHGIKDVNLYTENNRNSLPSEVVSNIEERDSCQCQVCYEIFDNSSTLEKHFRSHGMAFMNRLSKSP